jgi:hypothetical protein
VADTPARNQTGQRTALSCTFHRTYKVHKPSSGVRIPEFSGQTEGTGDRNRSIAATRAVKAFWPVAAVDRFALNIRRLISFH